MAAKSTGSLDDWVEAIGLGQHDVFFSKRDIDSGNLRTPILDDRKEPALATGHREKPLGELDVLRESPTGSPSPERRQVTVLCCDMVGATELATRFDPEDLREVLSAYLDLCAREVERHGGIVARYMGDGLIGYFGYPNAFEDAAERAVRAGCALAAGVAVLRPRPDVTLEADPEWIRNYPSRNFKAQDGIGGSPRRAKKMVA